MRIWIRLAAPLLLLCLTPPLHAFSGVVLWQKGEHSRAVAVQGHADPLLRKGQLTADTPLHIGSVTKLFTAVMVMQLIGAEEIKLDTAIGTLIPELPPAAAGITVRQLLQHKSGLPQWQAEVIETEGRPVQVVPGIASAELNARVLAFAGGTPRAAPGSPFFYNNTDYLLLGIVLERVTGRPYSVLLEERVLKPLRMHSTYIDTVPANPVRRRPARDATVQGDKLVPRLPTTIANYGAAAAAISTANDLSRFAAGLRDGQLLAGPLREQLFAEGLSVWAYDFSDARLAAPVSAVERQGSVGSYRSALILLPQQRAWMIVLANTDGEDYSTWIPTSFTHKLLAALLADEPVTSALQSALMLGAKPR